MSNLPDTPKPEGGSFRFAVGDNRSAVKYSRPELIARIAWAVCAVLFRLSPRLLWGFRVRLLRLFNAKIGSGVRIFPNVSIMMPWNLTLGDDVTIGSGVNLYALGAITIGDGSTVSQGVHLCAGTHDYRDPAMVLLKPPVTIGQSVWVCADAFIGPGVVLGDASVVAARAVVTKNVDGGKIVGGNPARIIGER